MSLRPFKNDYAGIWAGHCSTRESALVAAMKHVIRDCCTRATITDTRTGEDVARIRLSADRKSGYVELVKPLKKIGA